MLRLVPRRHHRPRTCFIGGHDRPPDQLATELDRLDLIDKYLFLVHPRIAGHRPTLFEGGLPGTRRLELVSAKQLGNGAVAMHYRRER